MIPVFLKFKDEGSHLRIVMLAEVFVEKNGKKMSEFKIIKGFSDKVSYSQSDSGYFRLNPGMKIMFFSEEVVNETGIWSSIQDGLITDEKVETDSRIMSEGVVTVAELLDAYPYFCNSPHLRKVDEL